MCVIALRQGDRASALKAFEAAMEAFDILLDHSDTNYGALDAKGLAMYEEKSNYIEEAIHAYTKARSITRAPGIVGRVMRLFDELARADTQGLLAKERQNSKDFWASHPNVSIRTIGTMYGSSILHWPGNLIKYGLSLCGIEKKEMVTEVQTICMTR